MGRSGGSWIMIAVCAASSDCRAPAGKTCRCADLHCARLFRGESGALSANERRPQSFRKELARKKSRQSFLESVCYVPSEKALASPPHGFATAGDFAMLESCPSRPPANREGIRLRRCSVGSNAQVPANWPFLQILAQSPLIFTEKNRSLTAASTVLLNWFSMFFAEGPKLAYSGCGTIRR